MDARIYEAALKPRAGLGRRLAYGTWLVCGLSGLLWAAWAEPFSARLAEFLLGSGAPAWAVLYLYTPFVMLLRAVLLVETAGYVYHRWFQHLGRLTRAARMFRRNQRYHWIHHMIIYPVGTGYRRALEYVPAEPGIAWSWAAPAVLLSGLFVASHGFGPGPLAFLAGVALYAKGLVDTAHARFHVESHPWTGRRYFRWLEEVHVLHHWDQRYNFTILHPAMDWLFGTYLPPRRHRLEIRAALEDRELTVSDLINWRYLLMEATPAEYAAFISNARRHPRSLRKIGLVLEAIRDRLERAPWDDEAKLLRRRALDLLAACGSKGEVSHAQKTL